MEVVNWMAGIRLIRIGLVRAGVNALSQRRCEPSITIRQSKRILQKGWLAALFAVALIMQGCFNSPPPLPLPATEPVYAGPAEYMADGYENDPFSTTPVAAYDPFLYGYYCPLPYYYYSYYDGVGGHGCVNGWCRSPIGRKPPHLPLLASEIPVRPPPRDSAKAAQQLADTARSEQASRPIGSINMTADDNREGHGSTGGLGGGFHTVGFGGGGFHGSSHR
jgi:hypothetical protein